MAVLFWFQWMDIAQHRNTYIHAGDALMQLKNITKYLKKLVVDIMTLFLGHCISQGCIEEQNCNVKFTLKHNLLDWFTQYSLDNLTVAAFTLERWRS